MDHKTTNIAIVSRPGPMQDTLTVVFSSISWINLVGAAGDHEAALQLVTEHSPQLLVVDSNLSENHTLDLIQQVRLLQKDIGCIVFSQTPQQETHALEAGADLVLPRDNASSDLAKYLQQWITLKDQSPEQKPVPAAEDDTKTEGESAQPERPEKPVEESNQENTDLDVGSFLSN